MATTSSGFTPLLGSLPKNFVTSSITFGILVIPPTNITSSISDLETPASFIAALQGFNDLAIKSDTKFSNLALVNLTTRCSGWLVFGSIDMKG